MAVKGFPQENSVASRNISGNILGKQADAV